MCAMLSKIDPSLTGDKLQYSVENQYFERKSARIQDKEIAHQISAMANASGGVIAVGIEDNGDITGVTDERENKLRQVPFDFLQTIPNHQVEILLAENGAKVFLFHVSPMPDEVIKGKDGEAYLRVGDTSRKLNAEQLLELEYSKGIRSYETQVVNDASLDDLDLVLIQEYCQILNLYFKSAGKQPVWSGNACKQLKKIRKTKNLALVRMRSAVRIRPVAPGKTT